MYFLSELCYICVKNQEKMFHFTDTDENNITYFMKIMSIAPELNKEKLNYFKYICNECSKLLEIVYNFRKKCIKNLRLFKSYIAVLHSYSTVSGKPNVVLDCVQSRNNGDKTDIINGEIEYNSQYTPGLEDVQYKVLNKDYVTKESPNKDDDQYLTANEKSENENEIIDQKSLLNTQHELDSQEEYICKEEKNTETEQFQQTRDEINEDLIEIMEQEPSLDGLSFDPDIHEDYLGKKEGKVQSLAANQILKKFESTHIRTRTAEVYECEYCQKIFKQRRHLAEHIRIHTGERPFECKLCDKKFNKQGTLTEHIRVHTGEKPYECQICTKRFISKRNLNIHMRTHTKEKPYECGLCNKKFTRNGSLSRHILGHTGEKPFECEICLKKFRRTSHLRRHKLIHSVEKSSICNTEENT